MEKQTNEDGIEMAAVVEWMPEMMACARCQAEVKPEEARQLGSRRYCPPCAVLYDATHTQVAA